MKRLGPILFLLLTLAAPLQAGDVATKQTIAYLQKLQAGPGGFRAYEPLKIDIDIMPTLRATASAVRALHYLGGNLPGKQDHIKFVESCWNAGAGGFSDVPKGKPNVLSTAVGLMAVVELKMPTEKYAGAINYLKNNAKTFEEIRIAAAGLESVKYKSAKIDDWRQVIADMRNEDGSYGKGLDKARDTASCVVTLLRLGGKADVEPVLKLLKAGQRQNGGWGKADSERASDLETTYRVMRCFVMLKGRPANVEGVRSFVAKCRNADGGYGVAPGQPSSASGTYFAAIITHWLKD